MMGLLGAMRRQVHVVSKDISWALRTVDMLRRMEVAATCCSGSLKRQMKYANRESCIYAVIQMDWDERIVVRDLSASTQKLFPYEAITTPSFWKRRGMWGPTTIPAGETLEDLTLGFEKEENSP